VKLSVVIPAYGAVPWLEACLQSLRGQGRAADEIIVFHSGPHDPAPDLAARFPEVRFLHIEDRHFAGAARNRGAAAASGDWLAFLDCDMRASPGWLAALERAAAEHPADLLVGSIGRVASGGAWSVAMWLIECGSVLPHRPPLELQSGPGANLAIARARFAELRGFPEDLFAAEDGEFGLRIRATGGAIRLVPTAQADHTFPVAWAIRCGGWANWGGRRRTCGAGETCPDRLRCAGHGSPSACLSRGWRRWRGGW